MRAQYTSPENDRTSITIFNSYTFQLQNILYATKILLIIYIINVIKRNHKTEIDHYALSNLFKAIKKRRHHIFRIIACGRSLKWRISW